MYRYERPQSGRNREFTQWGFEMFGSDSVEADDIFQEAMTRAYLASPSFFERARPGAWLLRICYNCFIDHIRSSKHHDTYGLEMAENVPDKRTADESFRFEAIWQAVCNLPEKERSCILLFYKEDLSIKDISSIMGACAYSSLMVSFFCFLNMLNSFISLPFSIPRTCSCFCSNRACNWS